MNDEEREEERERILARLTERVKEAGRDALRAMEALDGTADPERLLADEEKLLAEAEERAYSGRDLEFLSPAVIARHLRDKAQRN